MSFFKSTKDKKHQCDICGNERGYLEDIKEIYQTKNVKKCCEKCSPALDKRLRQVYKIGGRVEKKLMKKFIEQQYAKKRFK